jgi:predicted GNAT superfamily acetyltransferase
MSNSELDPRFQLQLLEKAQDMTDVENLQAVVWPDDEREIVPAHLLLSAAGNGGLVIGAIDTEATDPEKRLVGFVFGYPGLDLSSEEDRFKHCSHMLGVRPDMRDQGIGFALKRAQWQLVRQQNLERITWTYDPLLSRNAHLNIARLGGICGTYIENAYGQLRDGLNVGLPSDRFEVDWWINSPRVTRRIGSRPRQSLDLAHFLSAGVEILNPTEIDDNGLPHPKQVELSELVDQRPNLPKDKPMLLVEIPSDFMHIKTSRASLALDWRLHSREIFVQLITLGYLVTDFIHLSATNPRSFYVLSHGESTL